MIVVLIWFDASEVYCDIVGSNYYFIFFKKIHVLIIVSMCFILRHHCTCKRKYLEYISLLFFKSQE